MRVTRAFIDAPLAAGVRVTLPEYATAHLVRVLRLRAGDDCVLFNGDGHDHDARLVEVGKRGAVAQVLASRAIANESPLRIVLLQGIARGEKMDLILQKATELGVARIVPVDAERTEVRLDGERLRKRVAHWRSVVVSACEQCGRARIPQLSEPAGIGDIGNHAGDAALRLTLDPNGGLVLPALSVAAPATVALAIGPEGGWSPRDRDALRAAGFEGLRLGPRILRTETAGLAAIAALQARYGDLAG
jgi:16S rRNA (uracil1498-N3)-methyltransferase